MKKIDIFSFLRVLSACHSGLDPESRALYLLADAEIIRHPSIDGDGQHDKIISCQLNH